MTTHPTAGADQGRSDQRPVDGSLPTTMRAYVQDRFGPLSDLELRRVPVPRPGAGEVLVRVAAAGVDPSIWHLVTANPRMVRLVWGRWGRPKFPVPGWDLSGTVVAVGPGVPHLSVGDRVVGQARGTFRECAVAPVATLVTVSDPVDLTAVAALPGADARCSASGSLRRQRPRWPG